MTETQIMEGILAHNNDAIQELYETRYKQEIKRLSYDDNVFIPELSEELTHVFHLRLMTTNAKTKEELHRYLMLSIEGARKDFFSKRNSESKILTSLFTAEKKTVLMSDVSKDDFKNELTDFTIPVDLPFSYVVKDETSRNIVIWHTLFHMPFAEIGKKLGLATSSVQSKYYRAKNKLDELEKYYRH